MDEFKPRLIFWESTAGCNLRCKHCRRLDVFDTVTEQDLSTAQARRMMEDIAGHFKPILVFSGGEPLFRKDIFNLASHAAGLGITTALATNGTLVDDGIAGEINKSGIRRVSISLDGAAEKTHDDFRGLSGSFGRALNGIACLKRKGVSVQVNFSGAKHNIEELPQLYKTCLDIGVDALHLFMLVPVGCGVSIDESDMLSAGEYEKWLAWLWERSLEGKLEIKATCAPHYYRIMRQRKKDRSQESEVRRQNNDNNHPNAMHQVTKGCLAGTGVCFISHKGEVFPCGYLPIRAGNVLEASFKDIWDNSPVFSRLRKPELLGGKCGECSFRFVCGGCRARAYSATGDELAEEPYCAYNPSKKR